MSPAKPTDLIHLTGGYFGRALGTPCTTQCARKRPESTEVPRNKEVDIAELDDGILSTASSVEELLVRFLALLHDRHLLENPNRQVEQLLKRYILAVLAVSCIDEHRLDRTLSLNIKLPSIPSDGIDELLETVDDIRDFYSCVNDPTSATPTVEVFTLNVRP